MKMECNHFIQYVTCLNSGDDIEFVDTKHVMSWGNHSSCWNNFSLYHENTLLRNIFQGILCSM